MILTRERCGAFISAACGRPRVPDAIKDANDV